MYNITYDIDIKDNAGTRTIKNTTSRETYKEAMEFIAEEKSKEKAYNFYIKSKELDEK